MLGGEAFGDLSYFGWGKNRDTLDEEVHMILVGPDLDESKFVALLNFQAYLFQSSFHGFGKGFFPVFHRTDQVVKKESFVVTFGDVFTHPTMLHLREPTPAHDVRGILE